MIVVDDLGWTDTGVYQSSFYRTPAIDRLAASGVRFTEFYTASPVCSPTRASLMTGRHPARLHLTNWIGGEQHGLLTQADYLRALPLEEVTIGEALRDAGYRTGYIGKWHLGEGARLPIDQGFGFSFAVNHAGQPGSYFPPYRNPGWALTDVPDLEDDPPGSYLTDRLTDEAISFLATEGDQPFFLVLSHYAVHTPLEAKPGMIAGYTAAAEALGDPGEAGFEAEHDAITKLRQDHPTYAAMIESTDESVARILEALDRLALADNTVVIFLSDNGGLSTLMRRSPNMATANRPLRAGKGWLYEGGIRAPLIIRWPGVTTPGAVAAGLAMTTDLYPTLLEMAGQSLDPARHLDGASLAPTLRGGVASIHDTLFWHFPHYHGSGNRPGAAMRVGDWKLIEWFESGEVELYDLAADLGERDDLATTQPDRAAAMQQRLAAWRAAVDARMPTPR